MKLISIRKHLFLLFGIVLILCAGCNSSSTVKNEKDIITDVESNKFFSELYPDFTITEVEIVKRQTDLDNKLDSVYTTLTVINNNDSIQGYIDMNLVYGLYNEGWILDECTIDYERENEGTFFIPLKGLELSDEEVSSIISGIRGRDWSDISINSNDLHLEDGFETYSITGTEKHKYVTFFYNVTLHCPFLNKEGQWGTPDLIISSCEEDWHISGRYVGHEKYDIVILEDTPSDNISVKFIKTWNGYDEDEEVTTGEVMLEVPEISFKALMTDVLDAWGEDDLEYITDYSFDVVMTGDYSSLNSFMYVIYWDHCGGCNHVLYIGADDIAFSYWRNIPTIDEYHRRANCDVQKLERYSE